MQKILLLTAISLGAIITYVDTRPNWDDTGITATTIFFSCSLFGAIRPQRAWLWAISVGLWIPVVGIVIDHNYATLLALVIAFGGVYTGVTIRKIITPFSDKRV